MTDVQTTCPERVSHRLREIVAVHFDPEGGTPYWLEQARRLGVDPRREISTLGDLDLLGALEADVLRSRPLEHFCPRSIWRDSDQLVVVQTGGSLGSPVWTAYTNEEFREAFVEPFLAAARHAGFPTGGRWLYVGPSGPHVIGRAAEAVARATGSPPPFTVDFDSRWALKLPPESFAAKRYLAHLTDQAREVLESQNVTCLFSTPRVLEALAERMSNAQRKSVLGVHYGGTAVEPRQMERLQTEVFPNAVHLSGYGNTLFGCCLELDSSAGRELRYFPHGHRLIFGVLPEGDSAEAGVTQREAGLSGRLVFTRLDRTMFIPKFVERDRVRLTAPPPEAPADFVHMGVESPAPAPDSNRTLAASLY